MKKNKKDKKVELWITNGTATVEKENKILSVDDKNYRNRENMKLGIPQEFIVKNGKWREIEVLWMASPQDFFGRLDTEYFTVVDGKLHESNTNSDFFERIWLL